MKKPSIKSLKAKLWKLTSEYVRRKDASYQGFVACYTCDTLKHWKEMNAGHAIGGHGNAVMFDLEVIRPQCVRCNMPPGCGMYYEFGTRLNQENGEGWYERKKDLSKIPVKLSIGWYQSMIEVMKQNLDELNQRLAA